MCKRILGVARAGWPGGTGRTGLANIDSMEAQQGNMVRYIPQPNACLRREGGSQSERKALEWSANPTRQTMHSWDRKTKSPQSEPGPFRWEAERGLAQVHPIEAGGQVRAHLAPAEILC